MGDRGTDQFGQLRRPRLHADDALFGNPTHVNVAQLSERRSARGCLVVADQHSIGVQQIVDGCSFGQEFRIR